MVTQLGVKRAHSSVLPRPGILGRHMCSVAVRLIPALFFVCGFGATVLMSIVNKRLVQTYGWRVFLLYSQFKFYSVLSKSEQRMVCIGWGLIGLLLTDLVLAFVWPCQMSAQP